MTSVAFLGLGLMGSRMAKRLLMSGHQVTVWDQLPERAESLAAVGATTALSPAGAVAGAQFVVSMLADPPALEQVVFGEQGCASALCEGHTMIEMSTMGPRTIRELRFRLPKAVRLIDAPVRGSLPEAEAGALIIMVGATIKDFAIVEPLLACLGVPIRVGGPGSGAAMKLAVNLSLGGVVAALGEALALATALGVDSGIALDILGDAPWGGVIRSRRTMLERGQFPPQLRLGLATKDFHLIAEAAQATSRQVPVARAVLGWLQQAEMTFGADVDFASIIAIMNAPRDRGPEVR